MRDHGAGVGGVRPYDGWRRVVIRRRRARAGGSCCGSVRPPSVYKWRSHRNEIGHPRRLIDPLLCFGFLCDPLPECAIMCGILAVLGCSDESQAKRVRVLELSRRQSSLLPSPPSLLSA
ncbi:hypothetical protein BHE74_00021701 [Ensete ventricosum]|nr:hypothetical protein GW17_00013674 [Ensete ventricosum]RWW70607.1 hypothetical protein BHE74_00021701 [Ensete ventricosum]